MADKRIGVGLLGIGVIGSQVAAVLQKRADVISRQVGANVYLKRIKILPMDLERPLVKSMDKNLFTTDEDEFFNDADISIVIELIGGEHPAFEYQLKALNAGKHVVTANKEVISKHHVELFETANKNNVTLNFEASVGGGMPIISPLMRDLSVNRIKTINTIINGTTNYILTKMSKESVSFEDALKQAQQLGYAESNPTNDIEGFDTRYKLAILSTLAFNTPVYPEMIFVDGITKLSSLDFKYAKELGYSIKLLAIAKQHDNDDIEVRVHPALIPADATLSNVNGVFNAVLINGDLTGEVTFIGKGAGPYPTSSAVVSDVINAAEAIVSNQIEPMIVPSDKKRILNMSEIETKYFIRMTIEDACGVLAKISNILGNNHISIASCIQKDINPENGTANIVLMTHASREDNILKAVDELRKIEVLKSVNNIIRVEE